MTRRRGVDPPAFGASHRARAEAAPVSEPEEAVSSEFWTAASAVGTTVSEFGTAVSAFGPDASIGISSRSIKKPSTIEGRQISYDPPTVAGMPPPVETIDYDGYQDNVSVMLDPYFEETEKSKYDDEIDIDSFLKAYKPAPPRHKPAPPPRTMVTNEVNVDSVIRLNPPSRKIENWRKLSRSSKGLSIIKTDIDNEVNVDSVIRLDRERGPPPPVIKPMERVLEEEELPPQRPPFGPPSMLDETINVDSVIRINTETKQQQQQQQQQYVPAMEKYQQHDMDRQQQHVDNVSTPDSSWAEHDRMVSKQMKQKKRGVLSKLFGRKK